MTVVETNRHIEAEKELRRSLEANAGRWVAVADHAVVAVADTIEELLDRTQGRSVDRRFRVPTSPGRSRLSRRR